MINISEGNLLEADAEALVNTVNCVGYMGKGIALQFKQAFPENLVAYQRACHAEEVRPGKMFIFQTGRMINPKYIINFPTKRHWKAKSRITDIELGLKALVEDVKRLKIQSVAIPPLGCGMGGLNWSDVRPLIEDAFADIDNLQVMLYPPQATPDAETMPIRTPEPNMTRAKALYIKLLELYSRQGYRHSLLEIQKLAYFLQESGEVLRLKFAKQHFGPYAENLNFVLQQMEGHFIRGYGDRSTRADICLLPDAVEKADRFLGEDPEVVSRLNRVERLVEGFETPYGMELLSTVHWVSTHEVNSATNSESAIKSIHKWSERKRKLLKAEHIQIAWDQLVNEGWIPSVNAELKSRRR